MTKAKKKKKTEGKADKKKLSSFPDLGTFFGIPAQKFRVIDMSVKFPRGEDTELKPMTPKEALDLCRPHVRCMQLMQMEFAVDPDKPSYKPKTQKQKG